MTAFRPRLVAPASLTAVALTLAAAATSTAQPTGHSAPPPTAPAAAVAPAHAPLPAAVLYHTVKVNGLDIFYREAAPANTPDAPVILLLHGFPTSSHMFRDLLPILGTRYRVIAPDYPGFGQSDQPSRDQFNYTFDNLASVMSGFIDALGLTSYTLYVQDYGAPIGFRLATAHPERVRGLIIQNGNAYVEGLPDAFWGPVKEYWANPTSPEKRAALTKVLTLDATKWQYLTGVRNPARISPDTWTVDQAGLDRPGNQDIQLDLFLSYGSNPPLYPAWQKYFRDHQPPTLIVWGKNDQIFPAAGAEPYKRDLKNLDFNLLDTGHFALEEELHVIATKILDFMAQRVAPQKPAQPSKPTSP
jgi:pimeloyl-ACP methyl ester carboxylesterase